MHVNGSSNTRGADVGIILESLGGVLIEQSLNFTLKTSNNQAKYDAIVAGLHLASKWKPNAFYAKVIPSSPSNTSLVSTK